MKIELNAAARLTAAEATAWADLLKKSVAEFLNQSDYRDLPIVDRSIGGLFLPNGKNECNLSYDKETEPSEQELASFKKKLEKVFALFHYKLVSFEYSAAASKKSGPTRWKGGPDVAMRTYVIKVAPAPSKSMH